MFCLHLLTHLRAYMRSMKTETSALLKTLPHLAFSTLISHAELGAALPESFSLLAGTVAKAK